MPLSSRAPAENAGERGQAQARMLRKPELECPRNTTFQAIQNHFSTTANKLVKTNRPA
jgi:hypothetical protein